MNDSLLLAVVSGLSGGWLAAEAIVLGAKQGLRASVRVFRASRTRALLHKPSADVWRAKRGRHRLMVRP